VISVTEQSKLKSCPVNALGRMVIRGVAAFISASQLNVMTEGKGNYGVSHV